MKSNIATKKELTNVVVPSGYPPWHSSFFVGVVLGVAVVSLPTRRALDQVARLETFTYRIFPDLISVRTLAIIRLVIAAIIWSLTIEVIHFSEGLVVHTAYRSSSKLQDTTLRLIGIRFLVPFTMWCWVMLGLSFSLSGYIALMDHMGLVEEVGPWILRSALILWEVSSSFALLVSAVVRYAIWPILDASGRPHTLGKFRAQMQHNMNSIFVLTEMALLGGLPVNFSHFSYPALVGISYILFTWGFCHSFRDPDEGPHYLYWFLDTTMGTESTIALMVLVTTLVASFGIFVALEMVLQWAGTSLFVHTLSVILVSSMVIKTR